MCVRNHAYMNVYVHAHACMYAGGRGERGDQRKGEMRGVKKENLPSKVCVVCDRPFTWRKKWENCWDEVTTCSKSCNGKRKSERQRENKETRGEDEDEDARAAHKKSVKAQKAERRARLEFNGNPRAGKRRAMNARRW